MTYSSPSFITVAFDALPSEALQGIIPIPELMAGDIMLNVFPRAGINGGCTPYFDSIIAVDGELMQTGGSWGNATPAMVAVFFRG